MLVLYRLFALLMVCGTALPGLNIYFALTEGGPLDPSEVLLNALLAIVMAYIAYRVIVENRVRVLFIRFRRSMAENPEALVEQNSHADLLRRDEDLLRLSEKLSVVCRSYSSVGPNFRYLLKYYFDLVDGYEPGAPAELSQIRHLRRLADAAIKKAGKAPGKATTDLRIPEEFRRGG